MLSNIIIGTVSLVGVALAMSAISMSIAFSGWSFWYLAVVPHLIILSVVSADQFEPLYFKIMDSD